MALNSSLRPCARGPPAFRSPHEQSVTQSSPGLYDCSLYSLPFFFQVRHSCSCSLPEVLFVCGVVAFCTAGSSANFSEHFCSLPQEFYPGCFGWTTSVFSVSATSRTSAVCSVLMNSKWFNFLISSFRPTCRTAYLTYNWAPFWSNKFSMFHSGLIILYAPENPFFWSFLFLWRTKA